MQTSGIPPRVAVPFADSGTKNTIPVPSQVAVTPGLASYTTGFPPLTMTPITAGGVPPYGADFNGILNAITNAIRWGSAGSGYPFDSTFAGTVTGYPKGALLPASDFSGYWLNTLEANSTSPENTTSATTGWVPGVHYGETPITGLAAASVTLTTLQAAKPRITLAGTLTANINLVFPAWIRSWTVVNNCSGSFSVTCKTPSGSGVAIPSGIAALINSDGTNITQDANQQIPVATATVNGNAVNLGQLNAAITALSLGNASTRTVGTGTNQIPDMNSFPSGTNWFKLPDGSIVQRGTSVAGAISNPTFITFPVAFTNYSTVQIVVSYDNAASAVTSIPSFAATPATTGLGFNLMGSQASGSNTTYCRWIAVGK